jgi:hypothetical protein
LSGEVIDSTEAVAEVEKQLADRNEMNKARALVTTQNARDLSNLQQQISELQRISNLSIPQSNPGASQQGFFANNQAPTNQTNDGQAQSPTMN